MNANKYNNENNGNNNNNKNKLQDKMIIKVRTKINDAMMIVYLLRGIFLNFFSTIENSCALDMCPIFIKFLRKILLKNHRSGNNTSHCQK